MTIKEVLKKYNKIEIELLLTEVIKKSKEFLYLYGEHILSSRQLNILTEYIRRREKGEPLAYILGYKDFMGLRFRVNKHTLIPRPETQEMVERIIKQELGIRNYGKAGILDVGTGSGCIVISLANMFNLKFKILKIELTATDISSEALKVAKDNALYHRAKIKFIKSNLLQNVHQDFDIIVANLPYVPSADYKKLKDNLKFEPKNAIFAKENGLLEIKRLLEQISTLEHQPKLIYLEFDPRQKNKLAKLVKKLLPKYQAEFFKDLSGRWRFVEIKSNKV